MEVFHPHKWPKIKMGLPGVITYLGGGFKHSVAILAQVSLWKWSSCSEQKLQEPSLTFSWRWSSGYPTMRKALSAWRDLLSGVTDTELESLEVSGGKVKALLPGA